MSAIFASSRRRSSSSRLLISSSRISSSRISSARRRSSAQRLRSATRRRSSAERNYISVAEGALRRLRYFETLRSFLCYSIFVLAYIAYHHTAIDWAFGHGSYRAYTAATEVADNGIVVPIDNINGNR